MSALAERVRTCAAPDCNEEIPADAHGLQRFCGLECRHRTQRERRRKPERPAYAPMPCAAPGCQNLVNEPEHRLFCSTTCRYEANRLQKEADRRARGIEPRSFTVTEPEPLKIRTAGGPPFAVVRERLERARAAGEDFARAWPEATAWPEDKGLEVTARTAALEATWDGWRRAYEGEPALRGERAAGRMLPEDPHA